MDHSNINHRRSKREPVVLRGTCRTASGRSGPVEITDLTAEGCCIFTMALALSVGLKLRLHPENFGVLPGVVRWASRGYAGIEFDAPLYGPVAEHLQRTFGR